MSLGDGLIEVDENNEGSEGTPKVTKNEDGSSKEDEPKVVGETPVYKDGSFEINEHQESPTETSEEDDAKFFDKTEDDTKKKKTSSEASSSDSSSSSPFLAFARDRANEGVFLEFNDEDWKGLVERNEGDESAALRELSTISMQEQIRLGVEDYKESLTEEERTLYEAKDKGLPVDEYSIAKRNFEKYSKIKEEDLADDEKLQIEVVSKGLEMRGFTKDEIAEEIDGYKALENLEAKAKKILPALPKTFKGQVDGIENNAKAAEEARQDNIRQRVARMKRTIESTPEIIPGIKLSKVGKEKIMKSMTIPVAKDGEGNPLNPVMATRSKNPDAFEMMIHYYHSLGLFNIDDNGQMKPDFSKIGKAERTKATDEMRSIFETTQKTVAGKPKVPQVSDDEIDEFGKAFGRL